MGYYYNKSSPSEYDEVAQELVQKYKGGGKPSDAEVRDIAVDRGLDYDQLSERLFSRIDAFQEPYHAGTQPVPSSETRVQRFVDGKKVSDTQRVYDSNKNKWVVPTDMESPEAKAYYPRYEKQTIVQEKNQVTPEQFSQEIAGSLFSRMGYDVTTVPSGTRAVKQGEEILYYNPNFYVTSTGNRISPQKKSMSITPSDIVLMDRKRSRELLSKGISTAEGVIIPRVQEYKTITREFIEDKKQKGWDIKINVPAVRKVKGGYEMYSVDVAPLTKQFLGHLYTTYVRRPAELFKTGIKTTGRKTFQGYAYGFDVAKSYYKDDKTLFQSSKINANKQYKKAGRIGEITYEIASWALPQTGGYRWGAELITTKPSDFTNKPLQTGALILAGAAYRAVPLLTEYGITRAATSTAYRSFVMSAPKLTKAMEIGVKAANIGVKVGLPLGFFTYSGMKIYAGTTTEEEFGRQMFLLGAGSRLAGFGVSPFEGALVRERSILQGIEAKGSLARTMNLKQFAKKAGIVEEKEISLFGIELAKWRRLTPDKLKEAQRVLNVLQKHKLVDVKFTKTPKFVSVGNEVDGKILQSIEVKPNDFLINVMKPIGNLKTNSLFKQPMKTQERILASWKSKDYTPMNVLRSFMSKTAKPIGLLLSVTQQKIPYYKLTQKGLTTLSKETEAFRFFLKQPDSAILTTGKGKLDYGITKDKTPSTLEIMRGIEAFPKAKGKTPFADIVYKTTKDEGLIIGGSVSLMRQLPKKFHKLLMFKIPSDIDIFLPQSAFYDRQDLRTVGEKIFSSGKEQGYKLRIEETSKSYKIFGTKGKIMELHTKEMLDMMPTGGIKTMQSFKQAYNPFYTGVRTLKNEGIKVLDINIQVKNLLMGGYFGARAEKDLPRFKKSMKAIYGVGMTRNDFLKTTSAIKFGRYLQGSKGFVQTELGVLYRQLEARKQLSEFKTLKMDFYVPKQETIDTLRFFGRFPKKPDSPFKILSSWKAPTIPVNVTSPKTVYTTYKSYVPKTPTYKVFDTYKIVSKPYKEFKYQEYKPYKPYSPYVTYKPYETYKPYTKYEPYTPYKPYKGYSKYSPYKPYTPYTPYSPYSPYTPYKPYQPYQPYTPYKPRIKIPPPPLFMSPMGFGKKLKKGMKKVKFGYNPSLGAFKNNIRKKIKPKFITGLEVRPIVRI